MFINCVFGYHFQIIINKEPTKPPPGHAGTGWVHYNMEDSPVRGKVVWDVKRLLEVGKTDRQKKYVQKDKIHCEQQFISELDL